MASHQGTLLLLAGAGALLLMSGKKKRRSVTKKPSSSTGDTTDDLDKEDEIFEPDDSENPEESSDTDESDNQPQDASAEAVLARHLNSEGLAQLGMLYQIKPGDTPLEICREALFGSRDPVVDAVMRQAAKDLLIRIDCGPWNQATAGVPLESMKDGHANIDSYFTQRGVSFNPIYQDNVKRILNGLRPTSAPGHHFALIWIPMINLDRFDIDGIVTIEGMNHPDTANGMGGSTIDPPEDILDLEFEEVSAGEVGCDLPEGDFRRSVVASA